MGSQQKWLGVTSQVRLQKQCDLCLLVISHCLFDSVLPGAEASCLLGISLQRCSHSNHLRYLANRQQGPEACRQSGKGVESGSSQSSQQLWRIYSLPRASETGGWNPCSQALRCLQPCHNS